MNFKIYLPGPVDGTIFSSNKENSNFFQKMPYSAYIFFTNSYMLYINSEKDLLIIFNICL